MEQFKQSGKGMVLRIERSSIFDGDGFRTVVFLKGCPLRCQWCSTPESQLYTVERTEDNVYGRLMSVEEVMREIRKDSVFFFHSGGGMTLSGGELLAQPEFSLALLKSSQMECIHTAVETSFYGPWEQIREILPYINTAYVDLKLASSDLHQRYCGVGNERILKNLLAADKEDGGLRLVIRVPVIPGINDSPEELSKIGEFCGTLNRLDCVQLLPYHRLGTETYKKLRRPYLLEDTAAPSEDEMERCRDILKQYVGKVS